MSHTLRRTQRPSERPKILGTDDLPTFWREGRLPSPPQQADNFIVWAGDTQATPDSWAEATAGEIAATIDIALSAGSDSQGWGWLNSQLEPKCLYRLDHGRAGSKVGIMLTMSGWERYEALKKQRLESRTAFMALKFGEPALNRVVEECVRPAVLRTGFELRVLTDQQAAGLIDDHTPRTIAAAGRLCSA
jgi:hypothetical protein